MEAVKKQKQIKASVVSKTGDKSIVVQMDYLAQHPKYGKYLRRRTKLAVHDPENLAGVGDVVEITECRPISKRKSWRLVNVVEKAVTE